MLKKGAVLFFRAVSRGTTPGRLALEDHEKECKDPNCIGHDPIGGAVGVLAVDAVYLFVFMALVSFGIFVHLALS